MIYKITGFTKNNFGEDWDCIAITDKGEDIIVDPFVGCGWKYENRLALLNTWFETINEHWYSKEKILLPAENDFKLVYEPTNKSILAKLKLLFK